MNERDNSRKSGAIFTCMAIIGSILVVVMISLIVAELTKSRSLAEGMELSDFYAADEQILVGALEAPRHHSRSNALYSASVREEAQLVTLRAQELLAESSASILARQERENVDPQIAAVMEQASQYEQAGSMERVTGTEQQVPEPATMSILGLMSLVMLRRPRQKVAA